MKNFKSERVASARQIALPVFVQTTAVALVVDTAQKAKMTNESVAAAVEKLREAIAITICNLPLLCSTHRLLRACGVRLCTAATQQQRRKLSLAVP